MADLYPNIPSFVADVRDGNLKVVAPQPTLTQRVLILGTSIDGPKNIVVQVGGIPAIESVYGKFDSNTPLRNFDTNLISGLIECYNAGCNNVAICRVTGEDSEIDLEDSVGPKITLKSYYAGVKYNDLKAQVAVTSGAPTITITKVDGTTRAYAFPASASYATIVNTINTNTNTDLVAASTTAPNTTQALIVMAETSFTGGEDGVPTDYSTDDEFLTAYRDALAVSLGLLEGTDTNIIIALGTFADPVSGDLYGFGQNLAQYCYNCTSQGTEVISMISMKPLYNPNLANIATRVSDLEALNMEFVIKDDYISTTTPSPNDILVDGSTVNIGAFMSRLAGPDVIVYNSRVGSYTAAPEAVYSGLTAMLPVHSAPTNKVIGGVAGLTYTLSSKQHNTLSGARFVTFRNKTAGTVVVSSMTAALTTSDFTRLSTKRICDGVIGVVRGICEPYIGQGNTVQVRNSMSTAIQSSLDTMKLSGIINEFNFNVESTSTDQVLGNIYVYMTIVPAFEIRKITLVLSLAASI